MLHFLYCFDSNYTKQAFTSIFSILENVDKPVSIHIITDIKEDNIKVPRKVKNHVFIRELVFYKISNLELDLYNLEDAHVTKATFYRLYLEDFLHVDEYVTYLDCDVICLKNPLNVLDEVSNELENNNKIVSFNTEILRGRDTATLRIYH
jgi:lipopolysaccharide biosynthesis glycosyltransferase